MNNNKIKSKDERKGFSDENNQVRFTAPPEKAEMTASYSDFIKALKNNIHHARLSVTLQANASMICLYWNIGKAAGRKLGRKSYRPHFV